MDKGGEAGEREKAGKPLVFKKATPQKGGSGKGKEINLESKKERGCVR